MTCSHGSSQTISEGDGFRLYKCTWECEKVLVAIVIGPMEYVYTLQEIKDKLLSLIHI